LRWCSRPGCLNMRLSYRPHGALDRRVQMHVLTVTAKHSAPRGCP
jgi:hypothetical protein